MQGAQPEIAPLAIYGEPHGPALAAIRIDLEIEAAAIGMPAGRSRYLIACTRDD